MPNPNPPPRTPEELRRAAAVSPEERALQWQLQGLEAEVARGLTERSLEELQARTVMEQALREDQQEVDRFLLHIEGRQLDDEQRRASFFGQLEERLSILVVMLIRSEQLRLQEFLEGDTQDMLDHLRTRKNNLRITSGGTQRPLHTQEKNILDATEHLANHEVLAVRVSWETLLNELKSNVQVVDFAAAAVTADANGQRPEPPEGLTARDRGTWDQVVEKWNECKPVTKGILLTVAAVGAWRLFRWLWSSATGEEPRTFTKLAALVAGGVFVAGGSIGFERLWDSIRLLYTGLTSGNFFQGLRAWMDGDLDAVRLVWGARANEIMDSLTREGVRPISPPTVSEVIIIPENLEQARYMATRDMLISFYCLSEREYPITDRTEIRRVFNELKDESAADIYRLWTDNKDSESKTIAHQNSVKNISEDIDPRNIFTAVMIIGRTYEAYQRRYNPENRPEMKLGEFLERVAGDPVHEAGHEIHNALREAFEEGNLSMLNLDNLSTYFNNKKQEHTELLCQKLGVNIQSLHEAEKTDFYAISFALYTDATLTQDEQTVIDSLPIGQRAPRAIEAARNFFHMIKEKTIRTVIPGVVARFNIETPSNPANKDIIKDHLTAAHLTFGQAFQLNVVSSEIDFSSPPEQTSTLEDLTLLFVTLKCLEISERNKYLSELSYLYFTSDAEIRLPSLAKLKPYFSRLSALAVEAIENKLRSLEELSSAITSERTPEQRAAFLERVRNADWLEFGSSSLEEGGRGSIQIKKDILLTLCEVGASYQDFGSIESAWDLLGLVVAMGGSLIVPRQQEDGEYTGVIYLAGKYFIFRPMGIMRDAFIAGAMGTEEDASIFRGHFGAGIRTYAVLSAPYVVVGGVGGAVLASGGAGQRAIGIIRGAIRGYFTPVTGPIEGVRLGQRIFEAGQTGFNWTRDVIRYRTLRPGRNINIMLRDASYLQYYRAHAPEQLSLIERITSPAEQARRLLYGNWYQARYERYLNNFRRSYNNFFGFRRTDAARLTINAANPSASYEAISQASVRVQNFMANVRINPAYASATDPQSLAALIRQVGTGVLQEDEIVKLEGRVRSARGVTRFRGMLQDARFYLGESRWARARELVAGIATRLRGSRMRGAAPRAGVVTPEVPRPPAPEGPRPPAPEAPRRAPAEAPARVVGLGPEARLTPQQMTDLLDAMRAGRDVDLDQIGRLRMALNTAEGEAAVRNALIRGGARDAQASELITALKGGDMLRTADAIEACGVIRVARGVKGLVRILRFLPAAGLIGLGAGASVVDAFQAAAMAKEFEENPEVRAIYETKVIVSSVTGGIAVGFDVAGLLGCIAFWPGLVIAGGVLAAGHTISEGLNAMARIRLTAEDYVGIAEREGPAALFHRWYTTADHTSPDESYAALNPWAPSTEQFLAYRSSTRYKIVQGLVIYDSPPTPTMSGDDLQTYISYRLRYIQLHTGEHDLLVINFQHGQRLLAESKIFAEIMRNRRQILVSVSNETLNLEDPKYNWRNITQEDIEKIFDAGLYQNSEALRSLILIERLMSLDINYINHVISVLIAYLNNSRDELGRPTIEQALYDKWNTLCGLLMQYVQYKGRRLHVEPIEDPRREIPNIERVFFDENLSDAQIESAKGQFNRQGQGVAGLYALAQYFGYSGDTSIAHLKEFFNEAHSSMYGVYWDGQNWRTNDRSGRDENHGSDLFLAVPLIIRQFRASPSSVLESEFDSVVQYTVTEDYEKRTAQVIEMAGILESAFQQFAPMAGEVHHQLERERRARRREEQEQERREREAERGTYTTPGMPPVG